VQLDVSTDLPLIQALYQATRETKEQAILEHIAEAKRILEAGADLKDVDAQGRTALHWAVFGSSYNIKPKVLVAYEDVADELIARGVEINVQTIYGLSIRREILYPVSTDLQVQVVRPSMLKQKMDWPGWPQFPVDEPLRHLVASAPMRTYTSSKRHLISRT
jgi:ankyrin repeat protein